MAEKMLGKVVCAALAEKISAKVEEAKKAGFRPCLEMIRVGEKPGDLSYEKGAEKKCAACGIEVRKVVCPETAVTEDLVSLIEQANRDEGVDGVLLFRPLPGHLDAARIENALDPKKDVDGMTDLAMSGIYQGKQIGYPPCTAQAVLEILDAYGVEISGRRAVVIGRSLVIGRPVSMLLLRRHATVTICHTRTKNTAEIASQADILIAAAGQAGLVTGDYVKEDQAVVDVGIHVGEDGTLCGDLVYDQAARKAALITPVPGGVGPVTTSVLALHVAQAALTRRQGED